jgi:RNA polymerase sigma-70 factor, ECF subfamily
MQVDLAAPAIPARKFDRLSQLQPDDVLMTLIAQGDRLAMCALFNRHKVRVFRFGRRLLNERTAPDDLVSEVFIEVWRNARRFEGRSKVSTWLLAISRRLALSMLRRRRTEGFDECEAQLIKDPTEDAEVVLSRKQRDNIVGQCLRHLSPAHREIVDLVYYHEKSVSEVADIIGCPQNTVKTRMYYARNRLAQLLKGYGIDEVHALAHT